MKEAILSQYLNRIILLLFIFLSSNLTSEGALEEIQMGKEALEVKNFKKSIIHFQHAMRLNPNSIEARLGYAQSSQYLGSLEDAKEMYLDVLQRNPKKWEAILGLCEVFISKEDWEQIPKLLYPALDEFPNNTSLRITEARFLSATGKLETATYKLQKLSAKLGGPADVEKMLAELYLANNKWKDAEDSLEKYTNLIPSDPEGFTLKAKLGLFRFFYQPDEMSKLYPRVEENLINALSIYPQHEESRFLLAKLKVLQGKPEEAFPILDGLSKEYLENSNYHYWEATIAELLGKTAFASYHYKRAVVLSELDEIIRYSAEKYSISNTKEEGKLRTFLGNYRKERYSAERNSLYFKSSVFHLLRASDLRENDPNLQSELLEHYRKKGDLVSLGNLIIRRKEEDPDNFRLIQEWDSLALSLRSSIEYQEGFLEIKPDRIDRKEISFLPEIFVFDPEPSEAFPEKWNSGAIIGDALKIQLRRIQELKLPSLEEETSIFNSLVPTNYHPYTKSIRYTLEGLNALDKERRNKTKIRFVVYGNYSSRGDSLTLDWKLYDRVVGKVIAQGRGNQKGRDQLTSLVSRVADRIRKEIPKEGKILKVTKDYTLISLGKREEAKVGKTLQFFRKERKIGEGKVIESSREMTRVMPEFREWERELAIGDSVLLLNKASEN